MRKFFCGLAVIILALNASHAAAQEKRYADVADYSKEQVLELLKNAETVFNQSPAGEISEPFPIVLHGSEIRLFNMSDYEQHKALVDKAAKLDAFGIVDIQICQTWMRYHSFSEDKLPRFVQTVENGVEKVQALKKAGYASF